MAPARGLAGWQKIAFVALAYFYCCAFLRNKKQISMTPAKELAGWQKIAFVALGYF